jgi:hypothetical protein
MVRRFNPTSAPTQSTDQVLRTRMWAEVLETRETPSAGCEDVHSLPHLPGMGSVYPIDLQPPAATVKQPLLQQARGRYAVGTNGGGQSQVNVYDAPTGALIGTLNPFGRNYNGGVNVTTGDVTGDGIEDVIVAAGRGHTPDVKVFDGRTLNEIGSFQAYSKTFFGGVTVAVGDVNGDGRADIVTGAGIGSAPHIKMFSGAELFTTTGKQRTGTPVARMNFFAWDAGFRGGATVAVGDTNGDGKADLVVGQLSKGGSVRVFSGLNGSTLQDLKPFGAEFTGGVSVAVGDVTGDSKADLIVGATSGTSTVKVFSGNTEVASFNAFSDKIGTRVAVQDIDGDRIGDLIVSGTSGRPGVKIVNGLTGAVKRAFPGVVPNYTGGLSVG